MEEIKYLWARPEDKAAIQSLLMKCELPYEDISLHLANFILAKFRDTLIGTDGIEIYGQDGLVRSLAVDPAFRGQGISKELNARILARAHQMGVRRLYLLTTTAESYSAKLGFCKIDRESIPKAIQETFEFKSACPKTAVCMMKDIAKP